jgi:P-type conjugative transfer protein TrbJ
MRTILQKFMAPSMGFALALIVGTAALTTPKPAYAIFCANCSTFLQQMFQYAEEINTAVNTAEQLSTQIKQYEDMVQQGMSLPSSMFNNITGDLQKVADVYNNAQSLGRDITNFDSKFNEQFKGYDDYLKNLTNGASSTASIAEKYQDWSKQGLDNARTAMEAAGTNVSTMTDENAMLAQLVSRSQSASGRQQAIQAGNEIAAQNVQQLQKLRDLVATQITMQGNYLAQQQERQSIDDAATQKFWEAKVIDSTPKGY